MYFFSLFITFHHHLMQIRRLIKQKQFIYSLSIIRRYSRQTRFQRRADLHFSDLDSQGVPRGDDVFYFLKSEGEMTYVITNPDISPESLSRLIGAHSLSPLIDRLPLLEQVMPC